MAIMHTSDQLVEGTKCNRGVKHRYSQDAKVTGATCGTTFMRKRLATVSIVNLRWFFTTIRDHRQRNQPRVDANVSSGLGERCNAEESEYGSCASRSGGVFCRS